MPKSKRNKTVDLSKTKKHGLEGKKELYKKIQSNVENYTNVFVFAVNDMRNNKMKNVREQWKQSRFCIGKNKVMAMALGRTPEEEYRPNLNKIGQMLIGERGLLFTNQSIDEVNNWFQSYSEGDFARSGNIATENVTLPEGPLAQFPHNLESYLRQLGLPTTLKKGVIHLVKEHVVCTEGDRLSPETARILKLLGYEMAEFRIKILSVWSQDGSFINLQSDSSDSKSKENATNAQKSFKRNSFELTKDSVLCEDNDDEEMEVTENDLEDVNKISTTSKKETEDSEEEVELSEDVNEILNNSKKETEDSEEEVELSEDLNERSNKSKKEITDSDKDLELIKNVGENNLEEKIESEPTKPNNRMSNSKQTVVDETPEDNAYPEAKTSNKFENDVKNSSPREDMEVEEIQEPELKKARNVSTVKKSGRKNKKTVTKQSTFDEEQTNEKVSSKEEVDSDAILKLTKEKLEESAEKPKKFSPKMTRARAAAANKKVKTPEPIETKRAGRKRKM